MHEETVTFEANHQTLCGVFNLSSANPLGAINTLFIHGAGTGSKDRMRYLARGLDAYDTNSFRFDSSGWGESSGKISENSLSKRVTEALAALELMKTKSPVSVPLTIIGSSMGGEVALRLLEHVAVDNLVLFCPGIYHRDAYHVPFDERFSAIIRQENSWEHSDVFNILKNYRGQLTIHIGTNDQVIPSGVIELLDQAAIHMKSKKIFRYTGVTHQIHAWLEQSPELPNVIQSLIVKI